MFVVPCFGFAFSGNVVYSYGIVRNVKKFRKSNSSTRHVPMYGCMQFTYFNLPICFLKKCVFVFTYCFFFCFVRCLYRRRRRSFIWLACVRVKQFLNKNILWILVWKSVQGSSIHNVCLVVVCFFFPLRFSSISAYVGEYWHREVW